jgi:hypothetical protein
MIATNTIPRSTKTSDLIASTLCEWKETSARLKALQQSEEATAQGIRSTLLTNGERYAAKVPISHVSAEDINDALRGFQPGVIADSTLAQLRTRLLQVAGTRQSFEILTRGVAEKSWTGARNYVNWGAPIAFVLLSILSFGVDAAAGTTIILWIGAHIAITVKAQDHSTDNANRLKAARKTLIDAAASEVKINLCVLATIDVLLQRADQQRQETLREMQFAHREKLNASTALVDFGAKSAAGTPELLRIGNLHVGYANATLPLPTAWLRGESLVFKAATTRGMEQAIDCARNIVWQLLQNCPLGAIRFTFIDPVAVGKNFNMYLPLANDGYAPLVVNTKAWSDSRDIEERLNELVAHMENVTQKYLVEFETLEEYNAKAIVREPYHLVVVADAPEHLTDRAYKQLVRIYNQGEKCGVYALMVVNTAVKPPHGFDLESIERSAFVYSEIQRSWKSIAPSGEVAAASTPVAEVEPGRIYEGRVTKLMDFGAFVTILPGREGLVHVSQISNEHIERVADKLQEGDIVRVKVLEVDNQGRIRLSMKAVEDYAIASVPQSSMPLGRSSLALPAELYELTLEATPNPQEVQSWIREHGPKFKDAMSVQVTREDLMKASGASVDRLWSADSTDGLSIPLGPSGASGVRNLEFRTSSAVTLPPVNAVLIGRPGSGKSNLMHILITNALHLYGPDELELYLLDFKDGVEFKPYASGNLPHIKVVAIESERQFGLSVLERVEAERAKRSVLFKASGVNDLPGFNRSKSDKKLPRILVIIDEFQQLFAFDDALARKCQAILEGLVRLGRNAGVHTILASQNLVGNLPKSVLDLISVRIALQCSSNDAAMVLAHDNTAAAQLTRPGEAIYNAAAGAREGNVFFQVALSNDEDRKSQLEAVSYEADRRKIKSDTRVFDGGRAADIHRCMMLQNLFETTDRTRLPPVPVLALGEPMSLTDATVMPLKRQAANNLLVICKEEAMAASVVMSSVLSLIGHFGTSSNHIRFSALDLSTADQEADDTGLNSNSLLRALRELLGDCFRIVDRRKGFAALLTELENTVGARTDNPPPDPRTEILLIFGLHRSRELAEAQANNYGYSSSAGGEEPNLAKQMAAILRDGPDVRVHTLAWCDAYANFKRALDGRLGEFGVRVCGPLNSADAMALIDTTTDVNLRDKRLVKYDEEKTGVIETFRPYELLDLQNLTQLIDSARKKDARA